MHAVRFEDAFKILPKLEATHRVAKVRPKHDPSLSYAITMPRGWLQAESITGTQDAPGSPEIIGAFSQSLDLKGPRVVVTVKRLQWEVDPLAWMLFCRAKDGWTVVKAGWLALRKDRFEVCCLRDIDGVVQVRRTTGFVDSGRLVAVDVAAPQLEWARVHDALWACGVLCELKEPTGRAYVETMHRYRGPGLAFALPASWEVSRAADKTSVRWRAHMTEAQHVGVLAIDLNTHAGSAPPLAARQQALSAGLREQGIVVRGSAHALIRDPGKGLDGWLVACDFAAEMGGESMVVRMGHLDAQAFSLDYVMVAGEQERCPLDWMRSARAFHIAVEQSKVVGASRAEQGSLCS